MPHRARTGCNGSADPFAASVLDFPYSIFSARKYEKAAETRDKWTDTEGRCSEGCTDTNP